MKHRQYSGNQTSFATDTWCGITMRSCQSLRSFGPIYPYAGSLPQTVIRVNRPLTANVGLAG